MAIELTHIQILNKIWPSSPLDERVMLDWANETRGPIDQPFTEFKDAHQYLLRECIGSDLSRFPSSARNGYTKQKIPDRIISKARFDSTLAPLLVEHFDAGVDLQLAYQAVVRSQGKSVDHVECEYVNPVRLATNQKGLEPNGVSNKGKCFDEDDHQDDEQFFGRPQSPVLKLGFPAGENLNNPEIKQELRGDSVVSSIASAVQSESARTFWSREDPAWRRFEDKDSPIKIEPSADNIDRNAQPAPIFGSMSQQFTGPIRTGRPRTDGAIPASKIPVDPSINSYKRQTQQIQARDKRGRYTRTPATAEDDDEDLNRRGLSITQQPVTKAATPHTSTLSTTIPRLLPIKPLDAHTINQRTKDLEVSRKARSSRSEINDILSSSGSGRKSCI